VNDGESFMSDDATCERCGGPNLSVLYSGSDALVRIVTCRDCEHEQIEEVKRQPFKAGLA